MTTESKFEAMIARFKSEPEEVRDQLTRAGVYDAQKTVKTLMKLQRHACHPLFVYVFGDILGRHYAEKFAAVGGNLLRMFEGMGSEERLVLLYLAMTDPVVFYYG